MRLQLRAPGLLLFALVLASMIWTPPGAAQTCAAEQEPNDEPTVARDFSGGCFAGIVGDDDPQDLWRWQVPASPATRWQFTVTGFAGGLTNLEILRVSYSEDGARVTGSEKLFTIGSRGEIAQSMPLLLAPGEYVLGVAGAGEDGAYQVDVMPITAWPETAETEPNDGRAEPMLLVGSWSLAGSGDFDRFRWELDARDTDQRWNITLQAPLGSRFEIGLTDEAGRDLVRRTEPLLGGLWRLHDLVLAPGAYGLEVIAFANADGAPYLLDASPAGPRSGTLEEEPNDLAQPHPIDIRAGVTGRLTDDSNVYRYDADVFRFSPDAEMHGRWQTLLLESSSSEARTLCLHREDGQALQCRQGEGRVTLVDLALTAPAYLLSVDGAADPAATYALSIIDQGDYRETEEIEPNDEPLSAPLLSAANAARGRFVGREWDVYRFVRSGPPQLWRFQATGTGLEQLRILDAGGQEVASAPASGANTVRLSNLLLLPGTHYIAVRGTDGDYVVRALSQGEPDPNVELEPNDDAGLAMPLAFGQTRRGVLDRGDEDRYRFRLTAAERVRITVASPDDGAVRLALSGLIDATQLPAAVPVGGSVVYEGTLLPDTYIAHLRPATPSDSAYDITLERLNPLATERTLPDIRAAVTMELDEVAAYSDWAQTVNGTLTLNNDGDNAQRVLLDQNVSDASWRLLLDEGEVIVGPGATARVGLTALIPPDAIAGAPVMLTLRAMGDGNRAVTAATSITPSRTARPVSAEHRFDLPEALLGSVNAASTALGAEIQADNARLGEQQAALHNSQARDQAHALFALNTGQYPLPQALTTRLAGDRPATVLGLALQPQGASGSYPVEMQLRDFRFELSLDGDTYETVLTGRLSPARLEQSFVLPEPVEARYARLVLQSNHGGAGRLVLDEWKVLVDPASAPFADQRNLADPALGGYVAGMDIAQVGIGGQQPDFAAPESVLTEDPRQLRVTCQEACRDLSWVIGFQGERAAQITRIEWVDSPELNQADRWQSANVYAALAGPLGPWTALGTLDLADGPPGTRTLTLPAPAWARYLRFEIPVGPEETYRLRPLPAVVRAVERASGSDYLSILGEWGWNSQAAVYEWLNPPVYTPRAAANDGNDDPAAAAELAGPVADWVQIGQDEDWYSFTAPPEQNTVTFAVGGQPAANVSLLLQDAAGERVPLTLDGENSTPARQLWRAGVTPGEAYFVKVSEPPRSVIFAWDTSGSVAPFHPIIYQALERFAIGVTPGQEAVNLLPFGSGLLLPEWEDDPTLILRGLGDYDRGATSSETNATLLKAGEALAQRSGARAIVIIGDWDLTNREPAAVWQLLQLVQPNVFALRVAHSAGGGARGDTMAAVWAAANAGDARWAPSVSDLELGFDRAATRLRQPSAYTLEAAFSFTAPPGPGALRVVSQLVAREEEAPPPVLGDTAVSLILDASGSMQQPLGAGTRIGVARETLVELVNDVLPAGTPVALRAFGHIEGNLSCRTDLVVPLSPLDPAAMTGILEGIEPQDQANTALAASLALAAEDLADAPGQKLIVLITDGEETCGGDPAAEIARLRDQGIDARVSIVGFAIDDPALKATFESWAELGGGAYYDATDAEELTDALAGALRAPYRVLNAAGDEVARGLVNGEPVSLPAGVYRVELLSEPIIAYDEVIIVGDEATTLIAGGR